MSSKRTEGEASRLLAEYEKMNKDLPEHTRRQMAVFALVSLTGIDSLEAVFDRRLGQTPLRHRAWFWFMALRTSGLDHHWDEFVEMRNSGTPMRECLQWLRDQTDDDHWLTLGRRIGWPLSHDQRFLQPAAWNSNPGTRVVWTKGGTWDRRSGFTKILLLGQTPERDYDHHRLTRALGREGALTLERELRGLIDPDTTLAPEARRQAVEYVRTRIPEIAGWDIPRASYKTASWFFQTKVADPDGGYWHYTQTAGYPMPAKTNPTQGRKRDMHWQWLPPEADDD